VLGMLDSISDLLREVRNQAMNFPHVGEKSLQEKTVERSK
jgi:hypothetical protein